MTAAPKRLSRYDPITGIEIIDDHVVNLSSNNIEEEKEEHNFLGMVRNTTTTSKNKKRKVLLGPDKVRCLFPPAPKGADLYFHNVDFNDIGIDTFTFNKNMNVKYKNGQTNIRHSFSIFPQFSTSPLNNNIIKNRELTFYIKVGEPIENKSLQRVITRLGVSYNDINRSPFMEIGYPTQDYPDIFMNIRYRQGKNVFIKTINQYFSGDRIIPHKWIGIKILTYVKDDYIWYAIYSDLNPFDTNNNNIPQNNWRLKADLIFTGIKECDELPSLWKGEYDSIITEGYETVDLKNISDREVDFTGFKPLHRDLTGLSLIDNERPTSRKAMIPSFDFNDYEIVVTDNKNTTITASLGNTNNNIMKKIEKPKQQQNNNKLSIPRAKKGDKEEDKDSSHGRYT